MVAITSALEPDGVESDESTSTRLLRICEVRYPGNARVIDNRGRIAEDLISALDFKHWRITKDTAEGTEVKDSLNRTIVGHRSTVLQLLDGTPNAFLTKMRALFRMLGGRDEFKPAFKVDRIGVRQLFAVPFDGEFGDLRDRLCRRAAPIQHGFKRALGLDGEYGLKDVCFIHELERQGGSGGLRCISAPMGFEEWRAPFGTTDGFPVVGLFLDLDIFTTPDRALPISELLEQIEHLVQSSENYAGRLQRYLLEE